MQIKCKAILPLMGCLLSYGPLSANEAAKPVETMVEKTSPWVQIQYFPTLELQKPYAIKMKTTKDYSELKLMSAIHWFDQNEVYGGILKSFDAIKNPVVDQWYDLSSNIAEIPKEAKFLVIVMHVSPTGQWKDKVDKFSSGRIQF
jgi:hypothetical protein